MATTPVRNGLPSAPSALHRHTRPARFPHLEMALAILAALLLPLFEWLDDTIEPGRFNAWIQDLTPWERVYAVVRTGLLVLAAVVALAALAACKAPEPPIPTITPVTSTGPVPSPTTTWEQVGA